MELWATGFNAWNQLRFGQEPAEIRQQEPDDLYSFTRVLSGADIRRPLARVTETLVKREGCVLFAGASLGPTSDDPETGYDLIQAANGGVLDSRGCWTHEDARGRDQQSGRPCSSPVPATEKSLARYRAGAVGKYKQVATYETGVVVLADDGLVYTAGDGRYAACLGREVSAASAPATQLSQVLDLQNLPGGEIVQVAAEGYMLGALTRSGDLYCWGGGPGGRPALDGVSAQPEAVEPPDNEDIADMAIGDAHMIVLTRSGSVFVRGDNGNGRLGLGKEAGPRRIESWTAVDVPRVHGQQVVGVEAGPRASFIITSKPGS